MLLNTLVVAAAAAVPALASGKKDAPVAVPACPKKATVSYDKAMPVVADFPRTQVDLCYDNSAIALTFTAYEEVNYFFNASQRTNDPIWAFEVMEAFIYRGTEDPQTYLELEINPNNVTFNAFIYNPSKVRADGAPMDALFLSDPIGDGITATTALNKKAQTWVSAVRVPLGLFNVDAGKGKGTEWRMNFFRTVTSAATFPDQLLGAWKPTNESNFHMTPFFGSLRFV